MATKIEGIKGIDISKSSTLSGGGKKTTGNEGTRDTSNGTTRDNSKGGLGGGNSGALDAAMIKMLLGQTELLNKKAEQINQDMKIAAVKEEDRRKREAEYWRKQEEYEEKKKERNFDEYYNKVDNGAINSLLSSFLGPGGVMLGKGLNALGIPLEKWGKKGIRAGGRAIGSGVKNLFSRWGSKDKKSGEEGEDALSINRKEEAAKPVNDLNATVKGGFDKVLGKMDGKKGDDKKEEGFLDKLLKNLLPFLPLLGGLLSGYKPLKDFGIKFLLKRFAKALNGVIKVLAKLGGWMWKVLKKPLAAIGGKIWKVLKKPFAKIGGWIWSLLKKPILGAGKLLKGAFKTLGKIIMGSGIGRALKSVGKAIMKSGIGRALKSLGSTILKAGSSLFAKITGKAATKIGTKAAAKAATKAGAKAATKAGAKVATKGAAKGLGKSLLKKIPGVGLLSGIVFGAQRALKGDWTGAAMELGSGALSTIPGVGTALSVGMDAAILARDIKRDLSGANGETKSDSMETEEQPKVASEGAYDTDAPTNTDTQMQQEGLSLQNSILDKLTNIEYSLSPATQKSLDMSYLNSAKNMFDEPPEPEDDWQDYASMSTAVNNPLGNR